MGAGKGKTRRAQAVKRTQTLSTKRGTFATQVRWDFDPNHAVDFNTKEPNFEYVTTPEQLQECLAGLEVASRVGFDIETTGFSPQRGCIRLMQFAVEEPKPRQWVVDCFAVD